MPASWAQNSIDCGHAQYGVTAVIQVGDFGFFPIYILTAGIAEGAAIYKRDDWSAVACPVQREAAYAG